MNKIIRSGLSSDKGSLKYLGRAGRPVLDNIALAFFFPGEVGDDGSAGLLPTLVGVLALLEVWHTTLAVGAPYMLLPVPGLAACKPKNAQTKGYGHLWG